MRSGAHTKELAVSTICGLALAVGQHQAIQYTNQVDLLEESSRALLNLAQCLREDSRLLESVYPEMKSNKSDLATLTQILHLHLDERIMKFLSTADQMMSGSRQATLASCQKFLMFSNLTTQISSYLYGISLELQTTTRHSTCPKTFPVTII